MFNHALRTEHRPANARNATSCWRVRLLIAGAYRHIGIALGQIEHRIRNHDVDDDLRESAAKVDQDTGQQVEQDRIGCRDPQLARGAQVAAGNLALERGDVVSDPLRELDHFFATRCERVAGASTFEQTRPELSLDLTKSPKYRGMINAKAGRRSRQRAAVRDCLHKPEIVPG